MKTGLIISEYNPFHNGHRHQIETFRKESGVSHVVTFMSGNFVQRGTPAIFDKYFRASLAVYGGCDLVLELPPQYAVSSAEFFAKGAILTQKKTHLADAISFGTESGELEDLMLIAETLRDRKEEVDFLIGKHMSSGELYPRAREKALSEILKKNLSDIFLPNNILALEYIRAIIENNVSLEMHTLKRTGLGYHDTFEDHETKDINPSATAIRKLINEEKGFKNHVPENLSHLMENYIKDHRLPSDEKLYDYFSYRLLTDPESILLLDDAGDGLGERILKSRDRLKDFRTTDEFASFIKTKRYAFTRIRRLMLQFAMFLDRTDYDILRKTSPKYVKILAFNDKGAEILKKASETSEIPIIHSLKSVDISITSIDQKASSLYSLIKDDYDRLSDYTHMFSPLKP